MNKEFEDFCVQAAQQVPKLGYVAKIVKGQGTTLEIYNNGGKNQLVGRVTERLGLPHQEWLGAGVNDVMKTVDVLILDSYVERYGGML